MDRVRPSREEYVNEAFDSALDEPPHYEEANRMVRPSVVSAFGHDTLDRMPHIDFYRNAGSVSGHRAVRPSLQELHDVFQKVSPCEAGKLHKFKKKSHLLSTSCLLDKIDWLGLSTSVTCFSPTRIMGYIFIVL